MANLEPYQQLLKDFIADIPAAPKEINSGAPVMPNITAAQWFQLMQDAGVNPEKQPFTDQKFLKYTGQSHVGLLEAWASGSQLTTCNAFAGRCGNKMGFTKFALGQFEIATVLYNGGLGHAWIPAESGARPRYGDIFRSRHYHMGVSLDFDGEGGNTWNTAEGGQGGKGAGCDKVKRKQATWNPESLQGWVDVGALLAAGKPTPSWIGGWWEVRSTGRVHYYHFGSNGVVRCVSAGMAPRNRFAPPPKGAATGFYEIKRYSDVVIRWADSDEDETFQRVYSPGAKQERLAGQGALKNQTNATKITDDGAFLAVNTAAYLQSLGVPDL